MAFTPNDIKNKEFEVKLRGYDPAAVDEFLTEVAEAYETLYRAAGDANQRNRMLEQQLAQYKLMEKTLRETMVTAQSNARELVDAAHSRAQAIEREAEEKRRRIVENATENIYKLQREYEDLRLNVKNCHARYMSMLDAERSMLTEIGKRYVLTPGETGDDVSGYLDESNQIEEHVDSILRESEEELELIKNGQAVQEQVPQPQQQRPVRQPQPVVQQPVVRQRVAQQPVVQQPIEKQQPVIRQKAVQQQPIDPQPIDPQPVYDDTYRQDYTADSVYTQQEPIRFADEAYTRPVQQEPAYQQQDDYSGSDLTSAGGMGMYTPTYDSSTFTGGMYGGFIDDRGNPIDAKPQQEPVAAQPIQQNDSYDYVQVQQPEYFAADALDYTSGAVSDGFDVGFGSSAAGESGFGSDAFFGEFGIQQDEPQPVQKPVARRPIQQAAVRQVRQQRQAVPQQQYEQTKVWQQAAVQQQADYGQSVQPAEALADTGAFTFDNEVQQPVQSVQPQVSRMQQSETAYKRRSSYRRR